MKDEETYEEMQEMIFTIGKKLIVFLIDSGAGHSLIRSDEWEEKPKLSGRLILTAGVEGSQRSKPFTVPLSMADEQGNRCRKHS